MELFSGKKILIDRIAIQDFSFVPQDIDRIDTPTLFTLITGESPSNNVRGAKPRGL